MHRNKNKILRLTGIAYTAYEAICQNLGREKKLFPLQFDALDSDEDAGSDENGFVPASDSPADDSDLASDSD